jgi:hypothetical protein
MDGPAALGCAQPSGVVRNAGPRELAHLAVRVTGADGYSALIALGEIAPHFAGRQIQLAGQENGAPLPNRALRLVVPGDVAGGRWVRDVVRIDVE